MWCFGGFEDASLTSQFGGSARPLLSFSCRLAPPAKFFGSPDGESSVCRGVECQCEPLSDDETCHE